MCFNVGPVQGLCYVSEHVHCIKKYTSGLDYKTLMLINVVLINVALIKISTF